MRVVFCFVFFLIGVQLNAQKYDFLQPIEIDIVEVPEPTKVDSIHIEQKDIKGEYWISTVYNPYKYAEDLKFPLQLTFEDSTYASPIGIKKVITSRYGRRRGRAHKGIDIDLITGDSIYSMFDGVVRMARYTRGHGRTVVVRHYNGLETVYAHLSKYGVKENDTVAKGAYLGKGGISGNARGSHLHLVVNYKGVSINPEYIFKFDENNAIRAKEIWLTKKWTQPLAHSSKRQSKIKPLLSEEDAIASLKKLRSIYIVKPGDTLSRISKRNDVTITSLCKVNTIKRNSVLRIGQQLVIEKYP
ncbi:LysM peptidoglycan-binding domain-containing protein [Hyunsoonleella flava]|uniref:LysM peptidoglycan-binding domain-containing protein n=1 Tax=Hyunsoonleella flava TaxID=2527939 RepID=A0A4Q9FJC0_9FLAO|nr:peptidoglycan DD-metalloendopeptidase family protein [Hyunsoonleella flava]TBN06725.1 LysM peptidoglycan-binding domain-containing protein [Hyunsoonleella flava]